MSLFKELLANANATYRLRPGYFVLTTCVGLLIAAVGIFLMYGSAHLLAHLLGQPLSARASVPWIVLFLLAIPLSFYVAMVTVAGAFGLIMVALGRFTPTEAKYYALVSRYPHRWFREGEA